MEIKEFMIDEEATLIEAMKKLDIVAKKVLFVIRKDQFVATLTDGDIRRNILKKKSLDSKIKDIANYNPKFLLEKDRFTARKYMKKNSIEALPIVNDNGDIISVALWNDEEIDYKKNIDLPVVIMAGGFGTRLYPYTKILPKPLIPVGEIPIVEHIINRFNKNGSNKFYLIVNYKKNMIKAYFNEVEKLYEIEYIDEDKPLGTGGGLSLLKGKINSTFVLSNCDILIEEDYEKIYKFHKDNGNLITMICSLKTIKIPYGVVEIDENGDIEKIKEKPELSFFTNTGMYIVEPQVVEDLEAEKETGFPDIIDKYRFLGQKVGIYPISENNWMDMGQFDEMEKMKLRIER